MLPRDIIARAGLIFGFPPEEILDDKRRRPIHRARLALYMAFWIRAELRGSQPTYKSIGRHMGGRDHSTIIHGMKQAQKLMETDTAFVDAVVRLATVNIDTPVEKPACNPPLQKVRVRHQQPERIPVQTPDAIEGEINGALKRIGLRALAVYWDGNIVTEQDPATFDVYLKDEPTHLRVRRVIGGYETANRVRGFWRRVAFSLTLTGLANALGAELFPEYEEVA